MRITGSAVYYKHSVSPAQYNTPRPEQILRARGRGSCAVRLARGTEGCYAGSWRRRSRRAQGCRVPAGWAGDGFAGRGRAGYGAISSARKRCKPQSAVALARARMAWMRGDLDGRSQIVRSWRANAKQHLCEYCEAGR
jgi:hypothetical protein